MTGHVMALIQSKEFYIIIYLKVDFSLIICHLIYQTFLVKLCNQASQLIYIELMVLLACDISPPQTYIYKKVSIFLFTK